jgi:NAD(P)-dependent dehydrogenase (short-subunit alcohol dehydrogenase family)
MNRLMLVWMSLMGKPERNDTMKPLEQFRSETQLLAGQVALVTGGGRGLGRAFAHALADAGAAVAISARSADQLAETAASITANGGRALALPADVSDRQAVAQLVNTVEAQLGPVDLLINNAGVGGPLGPIWEVDPDDWWRNIEINLRSVLLCSRAVLPGMVARRRGRIINVASVAGLAAIPYGSAYVTSKTAMIRLSETLAAETKAYGIRVFAIHPGLVRTAMAEYGIESPEAKRWWPWYRLLFEEGHDVSVEFAVQLVLRLAAGEADPLSGRFLSITDEISGLVKRTAAIEQGQLYTLQLPILTQGE